MNRTRMQYIRRWKRRDAILARKRGRGLICRIRRALRTPWWKLIRVFR